jgi:hypothetical protein
VRYAEKVDEAARLTPDLPKSVIAASTVLHVKPHTPSILHPLAVVSVYPYFWLKGPTG